MMPKFRAWDRVNKKLKQVYSINFDKNGEIESIKEEYTEPNEAYAMFDIRYFEFMQSTGLKDKNGTEIFEGDIVRIKSSDGVDYKAVIMFKDGGFCAVDGIEDNYSTRRYQLHKGDFELEVIGNIYENPELLEDDNHASN